MDSVIANPKGEAIQNLAKLDCFVAKGFSQ
jgi:hypothetical protein